MKSMELRASKQDPPLTCTYAAPLLLPPASYTACHHTSPVTSQPNAYMSMHMRVNAAKYIYQTKLSVQKTRDGRGHAVHAL